MKREPREDETVTRIEALMREKGIPERVTILDLGLNSNSIPRWRYENSKSHLKKIREIADYLGVTVAFLLEGDCEIAEHVLTDKETVMVKLYRNIATEQQDALVALLKTMVSEKGTRSRFSDWRRCDFHGDTCRGTGTARRNGCRCRKRREEGGAFLSVHDSRPYADRCGRRG